MLHMQYFNMRMYAYTYVYRYMYMCVCARFVLYIVSYHTVLDNIIWDNCVKSDFVTF